jgi:hypothetical protein
MVNVFTVVGEHKTDATRLLVLGSDGKYYDCVPARQRFVPVEPGTHWLIYAHRTPHAAGSATVEVHPPARAAKRPA